MSDEWTAENVMSMLQGSQRNTPYSDIADAHNAALAAAFRAGASKLKFEAEDELDQIGDLQQQLAAEREVGGNTAIALAQQITKLEDQLDTAVEALKLLKVGAVTKIDRKVAEVALEKVSEKYQK